MVRWDRKSSQYAGVNRRDRLKEPDELVQSCRKKNTKASNSSLKKSVSPLRSPICKDHGLPVRNFTVSGKRPITGERGDAMKCVAWK